MDRLGGASSMHSGCGCNQAWDRREAATVNDKGCDSFQCTYQQSKQARKANTYLHRLRHCRIITVHSKLKSYSVPGWHWEMDGMEQKLRAKALFLFFLLPAERCQGQRYDGSACDGAAVSCDQHRKTRWKGRKMRRRGNAIRTITSAAGRDRIHKCEIGTNQEARERRRMEARWQKQTNSDKVNKTNESV